jgi:uncharacterized SAM-binding protein YcdF (DUF218 family)
VRRLRSWLLAGGILALLACGGFLLFLQAIPEAPDAPQRRADGIVVLTGGAERVETGLRLLEDGAAPVLLVSGAAPALTLAELARAHGRDAATLAGRVTLGHAAATTTGNAAEAAAWVRGRSPRSLRVVTAGYHMPRALLELRRALPGVELLAHPVGPQALTQGAVPPLRAARLLLGEYVKYGLALVGFTRYAIARETARR